MPWFLTAVTTPFPLQSTEAGDDLRFGWLPTISKFMFLFMFLSSGFRTFWVNYSWVRSPK
jgi:hypothetical protein